ncbi:hypothetical protein P3S68_025728 [Capsicum galapagoense]
MTPLAFTGLCEILVRDGGLRPTLQVTVEEQVAKTLYLLAHNVTNRELSFIFRWSGESVSRHFHVVLRAILGLYEKFIKQPDGSHDCIGAIDGTHIRVKVSQHKAPKYHGRKDYPIQNVLAACTFDLKFTYVLAGWEGTESDSRIMKEALNSQDSLKIPEERAFGVLKKRFPIISSSIESSYGIETQKLIIFACYVLHNYLRGVDPNDELLAQVDVQLMNDNTVHEEPPNSRESNEEFRRGN